MQLSTRKFAEHPEFVLQQFDEQNQSVGVGKIAGSMSHASVSTQVNMAMTTPEQLNTWLEYENRRTEAVRKGRVLPLAPENTGAAAELMRSVKAARRRMQGTGEHSVEIRKKMYAKQTRFGMHHVYITISPDHLLDPLAMKLAGLEPISDADIASLSVEALHEKFTAIAQKIAKNPVACAVAFRHMLDTYITEVIGYDGTANDVDGKASINPKLMDEVIAYDGMIEEQARSNLHIHMIIQVVGMPNTIKQFVTLLQNTAQSGTAHIVVTKLIDYSESLQHHNAFDLREKRAAENYESCPVCRSEIAAIKTTAAQFTSSVEIADCDTVQLPIAPKLHPVPIDDAIANLSKPGRTVADPIRISCSQCATQ